MKNSVRFQIFLLYQKYVCINVKLGDFMGVLYKQVLYSEVPIFIFIYSNK